MGGEDPNRHDDHEEHASSHGHVDQHDSGGAHDIHMRSEGEPPSGVSLAANGVRLSLDTTRLEPGTPTTLTYRVRADDGTVVTDFERIHGKRSHLILARRDLTNFQHRHPDLASDGTWSQPVTIDDPGVYRAFVDVRTAGQTTTLGADLFVPGQFDPAPPPASTREAESDDYTVTLHTDDIQAGTNTTLDFAVEHTDGTTPDLHEYLDALGHLVALRDGDLAYLHVHPEDTDPSRGHIRFATRFPTPGRYRLFLQAKPDGTLITTQFDVTIPEPGTG